MTFAGNFIVLQCLNGRVIAAENRIPLFRIPVQLAKMGLAEALCDKGRFAGFLRAVPGLGGGR